MANLLQKVGENDQVGRLEQFTGSLMYFLATVVTPRLAQQLELDNDDLDDSSFEELLQAVVMFCENHANYMVKMAGNFPDTFETTVR